MGESKYKGQIARCEVESMVAPLMDKEPTPAWYRDFKEVLTHYDVSSALLSRLAVERGGSNTLGHKYSKYTLKNMINNFIRRDGSMTWTKNAQAVINDHLDILVDYLSRNDDLKPGCYESVTDTPEPEDKLVLTLKERLEKELEEGKWPKVEEKRKTQNDIRKEAGLELIEEPRPEVLNNEGMIKVANELVKAPLRVRPRKIHKHHKSHTITININLGR